MLLVIDIGNTDIVFGFYAENTWKVILRTPTHQPWSPLRLQMWLVKELKEKGFDSYQPDSIIGLAGVESTYEKELRGTPGIELVQVDFKNRPVGTESYQPPKSGNDIQLHIDIEVQIRAEQALVERLNVLRGTAQRDGTIRGAPAGSVVVLDPRDGGVVALASAPSYDPQEFAAE